MDEILVQVEPHSDEVAKSLREGLLSYNRSFLGDYDWEPLLVVARDSAGLLIGGAIGGIHLKWLHVDILWVSENFRRVGVGSKLLLEFEGIGRHRGATRAQLDTHEFQAVEFYKRHGYAEFGRIENFALDFDRVFLEKRL